MPDHDENTVTGVARRRFLQGSMFGVGTLALGVPLSLGTQQAMAHDAAWAERKEKVRVRDLDMAYYEVGSGDPIIFLHGNPTSSYLWRNIIPHVQHLGRCIAPDMIGMGDSDPLPDSGRGAYKFATHRDYLFDLFDAIGVTNNVTLVIHDWGSGVGLAYGERYPERVKGIAYMEAILRPSALSLPPEPTQGIFSVFRSDRGEPAILENNVFVEQILIGGLGYFLSEADKAEYRRPYLQPGESRRPTLTWPRELPFAGGPDDTTALVQSYTDWFGGSDLPKLFLRARPGALLSTAADDAELLEWVRSLSNQTEAAIFGTHYVQETSADAIGRAIADWMNSEAFRL
ncbi:MAG: haloalkane dehalogenase [Pseudohongiellaceae bacterium]